MEEQFYLIYCSKGLTLTDLESMTHKERKWWVDRLGKQVKAELAELKKR